MKAIVISDIHIFGAEDPLYESFLAMMRDTGGYRDVHAHALTGGVAYVYVGEVA